MQITKSAASPRVTKIKIVLANKYKITNTQNKHRTTTMFPIAQFSCSTFSFMHSQRKLTRIFFVFFILLLHTNTFAQTKNKTSKNKKDDIAYKIKEINTLLSYYGTLSTFSDNENRFEIIDSVGRGITTLLLYILNDKRIVNYPIETLLNRDELSIIKSMDNKIYFFSIDQKTGGSYRPNTTLIHYRLLNGNVNAGYFESDAAPYGEVFLLDSLKQEYFILESVQTCTTCNASLASTLTLDSNSYRTNVVAQYEGRYTDLKVFDYNSKQKLFVYEYYAADNEDSLYGGNNDNKTLQHKYKSKFSYSNGLFLEIEKCELWEKKE